MTNALDKIITYKKDEVARLKQTVSEADLLAKAKAMGPARGFKRRLDEVSARGENALICEIKRKSPSAGEILPGADPIAIASEYEAGGAACLSVLTDFPSFGGRLDDLVAAKAQVSLPILRKDFMVDALQIIEARAYGADCILLILASLGNGLADDLGQLAGEVGLDVLTEVHDEAETERALKLGASMIGVNNRNLKTMTTDLAISERVAKAFPDIQFISESGVKTQGDIQRLRQSRYSRFLIGESLMKEDDREGAVRQLVSAK